MKIDVAGLNGLDWVLILILVVSTVRAGMRGLLRALFGLLGFVGGFELASWNYVSLGDWLFQRGWMKSIPTARIVAFLVLAAAVVVAFELAGRGLKRSAHMLGLGAFDRAFGAAFGFVRGLLLGVALIVAVTAFAPRSGWVEGSRLSSYFLGAAHAVSFVVPHDLH